MNCNHGFWLVTRVGLEVIENSTISIICFYCPANIIVLILTWVLVWLRLFVTRPLEDILGAVWVEELCVSVDRCEPKKKLLECMRFFPESSIHYLNRKTPPVIEYDNI